MLIEAVCMLVMGLNTPEEGYRSFAEPVPMRMSVPSLERAEFHSAIEAGRQRVLREMELRRSLRNVPYNIDLIAIGWACGADAEIKAMGETEWVQSANWYGTLPEEDSRVFMLDWIEQKKAEKPEGIEIVPEVIRPEPGT